MSTPHNQAERGQIAEKILLPGDPLRAKYIAEHYLENVQQFNGTRNMFGYTGTYKGQPVSVMGSGMGIPSISIYAHELIHPYGVKKLIRVGTAGAYTDQLNLYDIVLAQGACTDSAVAYQHDLHGTFSAISAFSLLKNAYDTAVAKNLPVHVGNVFSSDLFYSAMNQGENPLWKKWANLGCLCVDMETYGLYLLAAEAGVEALTLLTISDSLVTGEATSAEERQNRFNQMMEVALEI